MVQRLPKGRKKVKRVEKQAVDDVCLIARNAIDRIGELDRPWVGLTNEEIENLMNKFDVAFTDYAGVYKAIESRLKEKNT